MFDSLSYTKKRRTRRENDGWDPLVKWFCRNQIVDVIMKIHSYIVEKIRGC